MTLPTEEFEYVRSLVQIEAGIVLDPGKEYLVETRLSSLAKSAGASSVTDFIRQLRGTAPTPTHRFVVEAMTTNETSFFRDLTPFDALQKTILPALVERRQAEQALTIWSAASSTGQELYSIAMLLREHFPHLQSWKCRLMGSDISSEIVARARAGRFSELEINRGLAAKLLVKYFSRIPLGWEISKALRDMVEFFEVNLTRPLPATLPRMDIICLRNVLIYFDVHTKRKILDMMRHQLRPDGYLLLGSCETTVGIHEGFERLVHDTAGWYRIR